MPQDWHSLTLAAKLSTGHELLGACGTRRCQCISFAIYDSSLRRLATSIYVEKYLCDGRKWC